jgi:hypothetical protein
MRGKEETCFRLAGKTKLAESDLNHNPPGTWRQPLWGSLVASRNGIGF